MTTLRTTVHRPAAVLTAAVLAFAALLTVPAAPASAAANNPFGVRILNEAGENGPACPTGWFCVFHAKNYKWWSYAVLPGTDVADIKNLKFSGGSSIDGAWAVVNNTSQKYCVHKSANYGSSESWYQVSAEGRYDNTGFGVRSFRPC
ncbi:peptidase inhibitor family I36 protein [Streptomyces sp. NPDC058953]|uniref:peptidase inhibitor family I36 protein n=1 Tax=unclassified Streptomyces TaxID=2593676 RepID=UPI00368DE355